MKKFLFLVLLVLLFILFLPWILSSPFGKIWVEREFSKKSGFSVSIEKISWSWFGPQEFEGIAFQKDSISGTIQEMKWDLPLWKIKDWKKEIDLRGGTLFFAK